MPLFEQEKEPEYDLVYPLEEIAEQAFNDFRAGGFPYRYLTPHESMQEINSLAKLTNQELKMSRLGYAVADTYHPHRWKVPVVRSLKKDETRGSGITKSPYESWFIDKNLKKGIYRHLILEGKYLADRPNSFHIINHTQGASNFRPAFALFLYRKFCPKGGTILDPSTGYGGRLVGFIASQAGKYIGIDPCLETHEGNKRLSAELLPADKITLLFNSPAEDLLGSEELQEVADFSFTSPPYFCKELYSDEPSQSCNRYVKSEDWRDKFLCPFMQLQYNALRKGSFCCINIANVKMGKTVYPLQDWTVDAGKSAGFEFKGQKTFRLGATVMGQRDTKTGTEPVFVFRKV